MTDNQFGCIAMTNGMQRSGRQRVQDTFFRQLLCDRQSAGRSHDDGFCRSTEQAAGITIATGARDKYPFADPDLRVGSRIDDTAHRLVAGNQRISHARKIRHLSGPQKLLRAGADTTKLDFDLDVARFHGVQSSRAHRKVAGSIQYDR